jgi:Domain of unknown function (DUF6378)
MRDQLLVEREKTHGDFRIVAEISQRMRYLFDEFDNDLNMAQCAALHMIAVKIARILAGDPFHREHWLDIAGYARLGQEACREPDLVPRPRAEAVLTDKQT